MEEARYWMWAKSKPESSPRVLAPSSAMNSYGDSWEEQAFAEDAAGILGGCVWPPRSYSCSFCRRDFRSAQALGGHMNVHRRERAGLKQSPNPKNEVVPQDHALNPCTSFGPPYSSQMCTFLYDNSNSAHSHAIRVSSPLPPSEEKVSSTLRFFSPNAQKTDKGFLVSLDDHPSWSSLKRDRVLDATIKNDEKKSPDSRAEKEDCVTEDLSMSLNLVGRQRQTNDEEVASCKRRRIEEKPVSFLPKLCAVERCLPQSGVLKLCSSGSADDLDLELRLGDAPIQR